jgi:hypothetical protein
LARSSEFDDSAYGVRYERETVVDDNNNFGPRAAVAWNPFPKGDKTVVRVGAGFSTTAFCCARLTISPPERRNCVSIRETVLPTVMCEFAASEIFEQSISESFDARHADSD